MGKNRERERRKGSRFSGKKEDSVKICAISGQVFFSHRKHRMTQTTKCHSLFIENVSLE